MKKIILYFLSCCILMVSICASSIKVPVKAKKKFTQKNSLHSAAPCVIKATTITFDENFEPSAHLVLLNQSVKVITQVVLEFDFSDMSGWANTSVSRSLAEPFKYYSNLSVRIQPGQTSEGSLKIPLPQSKAKDKPIITLIKIRFADGSISDL